MSVSAQAQKKALAMGIHVFTLQLAQDLHCWAWPLKQNCLGQQKSRLPELPLHVHYWDYWSSHKSRSHGPPRHKWTVHLKFAGVGRGGGGGGWILFHLQPSGTTVYHILVAGPMAGYCYYLLWCLSPPHCNCPLASCQSFGHLQTLQRMSKSVPQAYQYVHLTLQ